MITASTSPLYVVLDLIKRGHSQVSVFLDEKLSQRIRVTGLICHITGQGPYLHYSAYTGDWKLVGKYKDQNQAAIALVSSYGITDHNIVLMKTKGKK